jgi:hypothetical protein
MKPPDGEAVRLGGAVEVGPRRSAAAAGAARGGVDGHVVHRAEVDHEPAVADGQAGEVVAAAAYRQVEALAAREGDRLRTCVGVPQRAISAGRRSMSPFHTLRASS